MWIALRAGMRMVLEHTTLQDVADNTLPAEVTRMLAEPGAWQRRGR